MTRWLVAHPAKRHVESYPFERPLLHVCSNNGTFLGDVRLDFRALPNIDVRADATRLPFADGSFAACFADFPWTGAFKAKIAAAMREMLRVAPVAYILAPWTWGAAGFECEWAEASWRPGVNPALLFQRYSRRSDLTPPAAPRAVANHALEAWTTAAPGEVGAK